jgi:3-deoxy-D-manno-octulosonic acid kinase
VTAGVEPRAGIVPPAGYRYARVRSHDLLAWEPALPAVREALGAAPTLQAWAAPRGRCAATGRGEVYEARLGAARAAVRHYRRGGWMRPLGDRYFDRPPRPFRELAVSEALRGAGVPTPRVLAAVVTPAHPGYRADIAVAWLEPGHDLEPLLRPGAYPDRARAAALRAAGRAVGLAHRAGLDHPDLQHRNLFVRPLAEGRWEAHLLDLDRARIHPAAGGAKKKTSRGSPGR